ncbi:MAG: hypothetical protein LBJ82_00305 [Deltaproteobacteria bacterium]|jgi:hypothetical protein|nr:hypothetical protein [Deltaproteobacteria bacterium]
MLVLDLQRFDFLFLHQVVLPTFAYLMAGFALLGPERTTRVLIPVSAALALLAGLAAFAAEALQFSGGLPLAVFSLIWLAAVAAAAFILMKKKTVWPWWPKIPTSYLAMGCLPAAQVGDILLLSQLGLFENTVLFRTFWEMQSATLPAYGLFMLLLREARQSAQPTILALFVLAFSGQALVLIHGLDMESVSALAWGIAALTLGLYALFGSPAAARAFRVLGCAACAAGFLDLALRALLPGADLRLYAPDRGFLLLAAPLILLGLAFLFVPALRANPQDSLEENRKKSSLFRRCAAALAACFCFVFFTWYALPLTLADLTIRQGNMQRLAFILARRGPALLQAYPDTTGVDLPSLAVSSPEEIQAQWVPRLALLERLRVLLENSGPGQDAPLEYFARHEAISCLSPKGESVLPLAAQMGCEAVNLAFSRKDLAQALLLAKAFTEKPACADAADLALGDYRHALSPYSTETLSARLHFFRAVGFAFDQTRQILDPAAFAPQDPAFPAFVALLLEAGVPADGLYDHEGLPLLSSPGLSEDQRAALDNLLRERKNPQP